MHPAMFYELQIGLRTLRREGLGSLLKKIAIYSGQLVKGLRFCFLRLPTSASAEQLVDFSFCAAGGLLATAQVREEIIQLADEIGRRRPAVVVEIGTAQGGTLFLWCRLAAPSATIVSIDLPGGMHGGGYPYWKSWIYRRFPLAGQTLRLLRGNSHAPEMRARLQAALPGGGKIDFLFIDGDHTYEGVKADYELYSPLVRPGGLIAFHDICLHPPALNCHVDRFWNEVKAGRRSREIIHDPVQGRCGIGLIEV